MRSLMTLIKMQLKEKSGTHLTTGLKGWARIAVSTLVFLLKFAFFSALCAVMFFLAGQLPLFELSDRVPDTVLSILFSVLLLLSVISCTAGLTRAMYFAKDNFVLLTLPASPLKVYLSKLIIFFCFELKKSFSFLIPMFVGYFITLGYPVGFYPWLLLCFFFISVMTVSIAALLSIPAMWISTIFKRHRLLQNSAITAAVVASVLALFFIVSMIPDDLNLLTNWDYIFVKIQEGLEWYKQNLALLYGLTGMISGVQFSDGLVFEILWPVGSTLSKFAALILADVLLFTAGLLIVRPLFYTMASKPFEYLKSQVKPRRNVRLPSSLTGIYTELLKSFKNHERLSTNVGIMISIPILIFLLNSLFVAMNTDTFGDQLIVASNLLIILLIALNANSYAACVYSRDGRSAYLIKVQPKNPMTLIVAKITPTALFCTASLITTFVILTQTTNLSFIDCALLMLSVILIYFAHLCYCADLDIMNPHTEIYAAMGEYENDPNEIKATAWAFAISFIVAGATLLLLLENNGEVYLKLLICSAAAFAYRAYRFTSDVKLYYKEK